MKLCVCLFLNLIVCIGNNLTNLASSVENLRSLSRIFPHLGKDLSNSLPTNFEQDLSMMPSPSDVAIDLIQSDFSTSSATSSISRSGGMGLTFT